MIIAARYLITGDGKTVLNDRAVLVGTDGKIQKIECDSVVFAAGFRPNQELYQAVKAANIECVQVGDNIKPGKIIDAVHQAYHYIRVLEYI